MSYLSDFKEINGGCVAFSGNPKGGKISRKGKIRTGMLDFDDVYFVKELKFNLFCVSQMCDKKNNVLFTDTECIVLSPKFKLLDDNQMLLRVPRENNMYNVDLKNIVPSGTLMEMLPFKLRSLSLKEGSLSLKSMFLQAAMPSQRSMMTRPRGRLKAKGKSPIKSFTGYRNLSAEFEDFSDNIINEVNAFELEDITYFDNEHDVGAKADFTNLETTITVSHISTTRVHKDHHVTQIIGDLSLATQTRSMTRVPKDQDGLSQINNDDFHTCMFACFLSQEEPKRVHQALKDPSWIEAMQEELL
nr:putative ribonuclease H-like domain-containing protein [Tanacetum cinerariifolium]